MRNNQISYTRRNIGFDMMKCLAAFMIVSIHCQFPGYVGEYLTTITRIAVPLFFMITGYYYLRTIEKGEELRQIKKIVWLSIKANLLYFVWNILYFVAAGENIVSYLSKVLSLKNVILFLLFNESPFGSHLWYLGAIWYVLIIVYILNKINILDKVVVYFILLLIMDLLFGKYSILIWGREFPFYFVRNYLFVGLPYFSIGYCINKKNIKVEKKYLRVLALVFVLITFLEHFLLVYNGINAEREHYIGTTFLAVMVFLYFRTLNNNKVLQKKRNYIAIIGHRYSSCIYIIHPIFAMSFSYSIKRIGLAEKYQYVAPIIVFCASLLFAYIYTNVKTQIIRKQMVKK